MRLPCPVVALELPSYQRKENWGAAETFYQLVRKMCAGTQPAPRVEGAKPSANILGPTALGFRHRDDVIEITRLLATLGIAVNVVAPLGATPADLARLGDADFNICLYPEIADTTCRWLERQFSQKTVRTVPIGHGATRDFINEVAALAGVDPAAALDTSNLPWWSRSVDSTYLTAKRVFIFGDATHAIAAARVARDELGFEVVGLGCYNREFARDLRDAAKLYGIEPLITDDYLEVEEAIQALQPELVLGTQMERHIAKRLRIPCAVISAPVHVQDFPARYSPQMGFEGANVLFDTWVHPLVMGLEEHLLTMFRDDFEFSDASGASHLGHSSIRPEQAREELPAHDVADEMPAPALTATAPGEAPWTADAQRELLKIPFFVRGKARRNTEKFAAELGLATITLDTLYEAKVHYAR
jgi:light-independent protochlorophyllide reductase subunit B